MSAYSKGLKERHTMRQKMVFRERRPTICKAFKLRDYNKATIKFPFSSHP
jgi:hypothetical protein